MYFVKFNIYKSFIFWYNVPTPISTFTKKAFKITKLLDIMQMKRNTLIKNIKCIGSLHFILSDVIIRSLCNHHVLLFIDII